MIRFGSIPFRNVHSLDRFFLPSPTQSSALNSMPASIEPVLCFLLVRDCWILFVEHLDVPFAIEFCFDCLIDSRYERTDYFPNPHRYGTVCTCTVPCFLHELRGTRWSGRFPRMALSCLLRNHEQQLISIVSSVVVVSSMTDLACDVLTSIKTNHCFNPSIRSCLLSLSCFPSPLITR